MVNDKVSVKPGKLKDEVKLANLKRKPLFDKNQADDGGDEGGGGAGKRKGHSYKSENLQKQIGKGNLKAGAFESFLNREGLDSDSIKDTPLNHEAKEAAKSAESEFSDAALEAEAKERVQDYLRDIRDSESSAGKQSGDNNNRGFFGKEKSDQSFARILSGQGANYLAVAKQSNIGAGATNQTAAARRGAGLAGSVAVANAGVFGNSLGEVVQQRGIKTIGSQVEQATDISVKDSPRTSMGRRK